MEVLLLYNNSISKVCKPRESPYSSLCNAPVKGNFAVFRQKKSVTTDVNTRTARLLETREIFLHSHSRLLHLSKSENTTLYQLYAVRRLYIFVKVNNPLIDNSIP